MIKRFDILAATNLFIVTCGIIESAEMQEFFWWLDDQKAINKYPAMRLREIVQRIILDRSGFWYYRFKIILCLLMVIFNHVKSRVEKAFLNGRDREAVIGIKGFSCNV